jgi:hypothetical protein
MADYPPERRVSRQKSPAAIRGRRREQWQDLAIGQITDVSTAHSRKNHGRQKPATTPSFLDSVAAT